MRSEKSIGGISAESFLYPKKGLKGEIVFFFHGKLALIPRTVEPFYYKSEDGTHAWKT